MKKALLALVAAATLGGCAYTAPAVAAGDKIVLPKNSYFLFGVFREVYVCKVTDGGVTNCQSSQNP
jgi:hypothetical protein